MKVKLNFEINGFEAISEDSESRLIGGFSPSISATAVTGDESSPANNCAGGNCVANCGSGQNVGCNAVAGCGTKP